MLKRIAEQMKNYHIILEPDKNEPEWWAGAPSVFLDEDGTFYLAARMREGNSPRGKRGYAIRILKSSDGIHFEKIHELKREDAGVSGFERPALLRDPNSGKFKLYGCSGFDRGWAIIKFDDVEDPSNFDGSTAKKILTADYPEDGFAHVRGYKDPFIFFHQGQFHMFAIGHDFVERIHHFASDDGEKWSQGIAAPVLENSGWHNFYTRPACVFPMAVGFLFVYEGSNMHWRDPVYNIATGVAYSPDLKKFIDLTPDAPLLKSTTPGDYFTWRYSHWLEFKEKIYIYFEAARANNTNEIRLAIIEI